MLNRFIYNASTTCMIAVLATACSGDVYAGAVSIANSSFELPAVAPANGLTLGGTPIDDWFSPDNLGGGLWDINNFPYASWNEPAPAGNQVLYIGAFRGPNYYEQTLAHNIQPNSVYKLSGFVGNPLGFPSNFAAELRAGDSVLASVNGAGALGSFDEFSATFNSAGSAFIGTPLTIRLFSDATQAAFDGLSLDVVSVPEPSTQVLASLLLALLAVFRNRRIIIYGELKRLSAARV